MKTTTLLSALLGSAILAAVAGCGNSVAKADGQSFGKPADPQAAAVKMQDLLAKPAEYKGKLVVLEGRIGAVGCTDCGGVLVTDKTYRIPVEPENPSEFKLPVKAGALIKVWGVVAAADGDPNSVQIKARGATIQ